jgi:dTDP-4-amino-4,6-dideoxygalactose transaminase
VLRSPAWHFYHDGLSHLEEQGFLRRPIIPPECQHNAHLYYIILNKKFDRAQLLAFLKENGIGAIFHYVPLHTSPAGLKFGHTAKASLPVTETYAQRLIRLPLWIGLTSTEQERIISALIKFICK